MECIGSDGFGGYVHSSQTEIKTPKKYDCKIQTWLLGPRVEVEKTTYLVRALASLLVTYFRRLETATGCKEMSYPVLML